MHEKFYREGVLRSLEGRGELVCRHKTKWPCSIFLDQLANGRLRLKISLDNSEETGRILREAANCGPFALEHCTGKDIVFIARDIDITEQFCLIPVDDAALVGYAQEIEVSRESDSQIQEQSLVYELINFGRSERMLRLYLGSTEVELGHWSSRERHHDNIARALGTAIVSGCIRILRPENDEKENEKLIGSLCELLSLRERAPVYWATKRVCDAKGNWSKMTLKEPPFCVRGWGQPLVPFDSLEEFLQTAYKSLATVWSDWRLYLALTYHSQAVMTSDLLQIAISVSTAFEALKSAYAGQLKGVSTRTSLAWISPDIFRETKKRTAVERIYSLLEQEFPDELRAWNPDVKDQFRNYLNEKLNMRHSPFREQLRMMFAELHKRSGFTCTNTEIDLVKKVRDNAFHRGQADWEDVKSVLNLLERTLLAVLGYSGKTCPIP